MNPGARAHTIRMPTGRGGRTNAMNPETIAQIIRLSLELTLEIMRGIPIEHRQQFWIDHQKRLEFWQALFQKVSGEK